MSEKEGLGRERRDSSDRNSNTSLPTEQSRRFSDADAQQMVEELEDDDSVGVTQVLESSFSRRLSFS